MEHLSIPAIKFISSLQSFYEALAAENEINDIFIQNDGSIAVKIMGEVYWDLNRDGNQIFLSGIGTSYSDFVEFLKSELNKPGRSFRFEDYERAKDAGLHFEFPNKSEFRLNASFSGGKPIMVMRPLKQDREHMDVFSQGRLKTVLSPLLKRHSGFFCIAGGTGSGKSTSLAVTNDYFLETRPGHIYSLEDPIEYKLTKKTTNKGIFSQKELYKDFNSFPEGLKTALRESPTIIMVGEIRDKETMEVAINASETDHLVVATVHASSADGVIKKILSMYQGDEKRISAFLAENFIGSLHQRLEKNSFGKRTLIAETLWQSPQLSSALNTGNTSTIRGIMQSGSDYNMYTANRFLNEIARSDFSSEDFARISQKIGDR